MRGAALPTGTTTGAKPSRPCACWLLYCRRSSRRPPRNWQSLPSRRYNVCMQQHTGQWVFERMSPMGGSRSTTWRDTLEGLDLPIEARIAREAIQNSADATLTGEKTELLVWDKPLTAEEEFTFRDILDLDSQSSPTGRLEELGLEEGNFFGGSITGGREVRVTIIEDHNTCGLGIDTENGKDRFEELCLFLGQDDTEVDPNRGGSYGFGKTVYQANSSCRTGAGEGVHYNPILRASLEY